MSALRNTEERSRYGITTTFEAPDGRRHTNTLQGPPGWALQELCDEAMALDESLRLVSYSTPETILTDMEGRRSNDRSRWVLPEVMALARIGRVELVHPRLAGSRRP